MVVYKKHDDANIKQTKFTQPILNQTKKNEKQAQEYMENFVKII